MRYHASPEVRPAVWDRLLPGQIPAASVVATTPPNNAFDLEGNELRIIEVGHTDTDNTTVLHVPRIGLVVAGDAVYNGVHRTRVLQLDDGAVSEASQPYRAMVLGRSGPVS